MNIRGLLFALLLSLAACSGSTSSAQDTGSSNPTDAVNVSDATSSDAPVRNDVAIASDVVVTPSDANSVADASDAMVASDGGLVAARPYHFLASPGYDAAQPAPLVILLHGYSATALQQDAYFGLSQLAATRTFLYAYPDGLVDTLGNRFWNATDACCNFSHVQVDDVAYVTAIIDDVSAHYNVDPRRIYLVGHSNGAFMSHRLACDRSTRIAAIVALAGANWNDMSLCATTSPVAILQVHGDADTTIAYNGGALVGVPFPSAMATAAGWGMRNGCVGDLMPTTTTLDLDTGLPGAETTVSQFAGCQGGSAVELWTIHGGQHIPALTPMWAGMIFDWLMAHPRP